MKNVFVAMSGGVDSSVVAALLKKSGYNVTGVYIKGWYPDFLTCDWKEERRDAMRVCSVLGIPFLTFDASKEYKKNVIDHMIREYKEGSTPNPDVMCNKNIKFGAFLSFALKEGAHYIATGHYAKTQTVEEESNLLRARDKDKDQSYFLWTLTQDQLKHSLFPLGDMQKTRVRALAKKFKLSNAQKKDSQGICFLGKVDLKDFLTHYIKPKKGRVLNQGGEAIGFHDGVTFLTIGQRHGFNITNKKTYSRPHYIIKKNVKKNQITVSVKKAQTSEEQALINISDVNWINNEPQPEITYDLQLRYRQKPIKGRVLKVGEKWRVRLNSQYDYISPGQSLVIYEKETLLGGGVID